MEMTIHFIRNGVYWNMYTVGDTACILFMGWQQKEVLTGGVICGSPKIR